MDVLSISWAGVRTQNFAATVRYFVENMGLPLTLRDDQAEVAHVQVCLWRPFSKSLAPITPYAR